MLQYSTKIGTIVFARRRPEQLGSGQPSLRFMPSLRQRPLFLTRLLPWVGFGGLVLTSLGAAPTEPLLIRLAGQALIQHDLRQVAPAKMAALRAELNGADVVFTDLETVIDAGKGRPTRESRFFHAAKPVVLDCLKEAGFNLLALGNNHAWDLGADGVLATIREVAARDFVHAGTGADLAAASAPAVIITPRGRVALVAFATGKIAAGGAAAVDRAGVNEVRRGADGEVDPIDAARVFAGIQEAGRSADLVIAYQHDHEWEPDNRVTPAWKQRFARACIDAGASLFVSHGAPLLHGIEIYRGRPIFYDLGGLIFHTVTAPGYYDPAVWESVLADAEYIGGKLSALRLRPMVLNEMGEGAPPQPRFYATRGVPARATGAPARAILDRLADLSAGYGTKFIITEDTAVLELPPGAP